MKYVVRGYEKTDKVYIFDLWKTAYSDEQIRVRKDQFARVADGNPLGHLSRNSTYRVVECEGKVIGYIGKMPVKFYVQGEVVDGYFLHDSLIDPTYRGRGLGKMLMTDVKAKAESFVVASWMNEAQYSLTKKMGWLDIPGVYSYKKLLSIENYLNLRRLGIAKGLQVVYSLISKLNEKICGCRESTAIEIAECEVFGAEVDKFAEQASKDYGIIVYRDASYLNWKFSRLPGKQFAKFLAYKNNELVGYVVLNSQKLRDGRRCGAVVDILIRKDDKCTFTILMNESMKYFRNRKVDYVLCLISQPGFIKVLRRLWFIRSKRQSPLMITNWEGFFNREFVSDICRWYLTYGDNDREFWVYDE